MIYLVKNNTIVFEAFRHYSRSCDLLVEPVEITLEEAQAMAMLIGFVAFVCSMHNNLVSVFMHCWAKDDEIASRSDRRACVTTLIFMCTVGNIIGIIILGFLYMESH